MSQPVSRRGIEDKKERRFPQEWKEFMGLLLRPDVSELQSNGPDAFFYKSKGKRYQYNPPEPLSDEDYIQGIEDGLVPHVKELISFGRDSYLFEGPLNFRATVNGEPMTIRGRCHVVLPPAADHAQVTIAKKSTSLVTVDAIASGGSMSHEMLLFMKAAMKAKLTIILSGGTGAGKTTMLEACSKLIPDEVRIGVAEDTPELSLSQPNVTYLHSVPWQPGLDPNSVATLSWVVQQFQRMRTDRVVVGETRGKEFADFLIAANSGMEGSMTTMHADNPKRCLDKMTNFAMKGSTQQPIRSINKDIASAVDLIIQLIYTDDGRYRMSQIEYITETISNNEEASITTETLYEYIPSQDGFLRHNSFPDKLKDKMRAKGVDISPFENQESFGKVHRGHSAPDTSTMNVNRNDMQQRQRGGLPTPPPGIFGGRRG